MWKFFDVLGIIANFIASVFGGDIDCNLHDEHADNCMDEDMMSCTDEWRALHPYDYNPFDWENPYGET